MKVECQKGEVLSLDLGHAINSGGEGTIYPVLQRNDVAAKIYHPGKMSSDLNRKLLTMLSQPPKDPMQANGHASIAWPVDLLHEVGGKCCGFLMPRVSNAAPIHRLYSAETRKGFPDFSYQALCLTASNIASAIWAIHEAGYVVGDVNDANVLVIGNALITLVDTDSFQVTNKVDGRIYPCTVATQLFTPPELLDQEPVLMNRTWRQDMFSLAILFFRLLMEGTQPYAGKVVGLAEAPDCVERLRMGGFPYSGSPKFLPSRTAPPFEMLHPDLQDLFRQCFVDGHADPDRRPDARTWYRALKGCENSFVTCTVNPRHHYFSHCRHCPWCERARLLNVDVFPAPSTTGRGAGRPTPAPSRPSQKPSGSIHPPAATPTPPPPPTAQFQASTSSVTLGQPVTLHWSVPNAHSVQILNKSGQPLHASNSANGQVVFYPARNETYRLLAHRPGMNAPPPINVTVAQAAAPVALKSMSVELNETKILRTAQVAVQSFASLKPQSVHLGTPHRLGDYFNLNSFVRLRKVTVGLNNWVSPTNRLQALSLLSRVRPGGP
jgi:serine/threonine protein kinase